MAEPSRRPSVKGTTPKPEAVPPAAGSARVGVSLSNSAATRHLLGPGELRLETGGLDIPRFEYRSEAFPELHLERRVEVDYGQLRSARYDVKSVDDYVERVRETFGSLRAYLDWAPVSDEILSRPLGPKSRKRISDRVELKGQEQRIFFRWVTWEYRRRGFDPDDIARLIVAQTNPAMQAALAAAEKNFGSRIEAGGFNPRPMKDADLRYILGTLSEHGLGTAVDIDPTRNPILRASTWNAIGSAVGKPFERSPARWWQDPEALYDDVAEVDARWSEMARAAYETKRREQAAERFARSHPGLLTGGAALSPPATGVPSLRLGPTPVLGVGADAPRILSEEELRVEAVKGLLGRVVGEARELAALPGFHFFVLQKKLVLALQRQGLLWGATFPLSVDLHHFELVDEAEGAAEAMGKRAAGVESQYREGAIEYTEGGRGVPSP